MIYLELDYLASQNKIRAYVNEYNTRMKWKHPKSYGNKILKNGQIRTAEMILEFYYRFLDDQAKIKPLQPHRFKINSVALATKCNYNKRTAFNHVQRLIEAKILTGKVFLGSNTGFATDFNTELLVSKFNYEFHKNMLDRYCYIQNVENPPEEVLKKMSSVRLSFTDSKNGFVKYLPHITTRTLQELNINMEFKGIVDNESKTLNNSKVHNNIVINNDCLLQEPLQEHGKHIQPENDKHLTPEQLHEQNRKIAIRKVSHASFNFIAAVFFSDRYISEHNMEISLMHLENYFEKAKTEKTLSQKFNESIQRVMLARRYVLRAPGRFIPNPQTWLDPAFKQGFAGTEQWLKQVDKKREENKKYYENIKKLGELYLKFVKDPSLENYLAAKQTLGKKKDKSLVQMFDEAVLKQVPQTSEIYKKMTA